MSFYIFLIVNYMIIQSCYFPPKNTILTVFYSKMSYNALLNHIHDFPQHTVK